MFYQMFTYQTTFVYDDIWVPYHHHLKSWFFRLISHIYDGFEDVFLSLNDKDNCIGFDNSCYIKDHRESFLNSNLIHLNYTFERLFDVQFLKDIYSLKYITFNSFLEDVFFDLIDLLYINVFNYRLFSCVTQGTSFVTNFNPVLFFRFIDKYLYRHDF